MPGNSSRVGSGFDNLVVPFIFVPDGDPEPAAWIARHPDHIKTRVKFVPRSIPLRSDLRKPGRLADEPDDVPDTVEPPAPAANPVEPTVNWPADPIGDYLHVDTVLRRNGFGRPGWPNRTMPEGLPTIREADPNAPAAQEVPDQTRKVLAQLASNVAGHANSGESAVAAVNSGYIASNPEQWSGRPSVGTGECRPLVQQATGAPRSVQWRPGEQVQGNASIPRGAAIATFDRNGHYSGHAAIYLGQDSRGIQVIDQWNFRQDGRIVKQHGPQERIIRLNNPGGNVVDQGERYHVVR